MPAPPVPLDAIRQPAFLYGADTRIVAVNGPAEALAGRSLDGLSPEDVAVALSLRRRDGAELAPDEQPVVRALAGEAIVDVPLSLTTDDGSTVHIIGTVSPVMEGDWITGALAIWQDVTGEVVARQALTAQSEALQAREEEIVVQNEELRCQAAELRESERRYRELVDSVNSAIIRWRADGTVTFANDYALALFGYAADELIGRNVDLIVPARESSGADLSGLVVEIVAHPERRQTNVNENVRADGTRLWMVWTNSAILDEHGAVTEILAVGTDITGRKAAEDAVAELGRESRGRLAELEALYDAAPIGLAVLDRDLRYVRINRVLAEINGLPVEAHLGRTVRELVPVLADQIEGTVRRVIETGETVQDVAVSAANPADRDSTMHLLTRWAPIRDEQGGITGVTVATVDITALKRVEEALRETAARYQEALNSPLTGFAYCEVLTDPDGSPVDFVYLDVNPTFEAFTGLSRGRVLGRRVTEILVPEEVTELIQLYGRVALSGDPATFQYPIPSLDKWYEVAAFSPRYGQFVAYFTDITERKRAEEALRESEERFRALYEQSHDAIVLTDPRGDGRILAANPAACRMLGCTEENLVGRGRDALFDLADPRTKALLEERARSGAARAELTYRRGDGSTFPGEVTTALFTDGRGDARSVAIIRDVTERKRAEDALREYAENLQRSNEDLQRFAYVASHDLQEPLRSIVSFSQLLDRRYRGRLDQEADEYIDFIVEGGNRMQGLILDLLAFSRVNTTRQQIARTDAEDVLAEAMRTLDVSLREADATLTHDPLPVVMADPIQLAQVFANLISNAVKFRRPDVPLRVHVGAHRLDGFWEFSVADNGIGIEQEYYERIFVIFQRLHTKDVYPGTGIGLAIVKRIIDRHGGRVWVDSTSGEGSTFFFTLPAA